MKIQTRITAALALLIAFGGAGIGCKSNGTGPWYKPSNYSFYNPFIPFEPDPGQAPPAAMASENQRPSTLATPDIKSMPGGYAHQYADSTPAGGAASVAQSPVAQGTGYNPTMAPGSASVAQSGYNTTTSTVYPNSQSGYQGGYPGGMEYAQNPATNGVTQTMGAAPANYPSSAPYDQNRIAMGNYNSGTSLAGTPENAGYQQNAYQQSAAPGYVQPDYSTTPATNYSGYTPQPTIPQSPVDPQAGYTSNPAYGAANAYPGQGAAQNAYPSTANPNAGTYQYQSANGAYQY